MPTTQLEITQHLATLEQLAQAAAVYYEAFAHKLDGLEFNSRPPEQAIRILIESIQPEMGCYALRDGRVVGVAGMQYRGRRFYVVPWRVWRREFGLSAGCGAGCGSGWGSALSTQRPMPCAWTASAWPQRRAAWASARNSWPPWTPTPAPPGCAPWS